MFYHDGFKTIIIIEYIMYLLIPVYSSYTIYYIDAGGNVKYYVGIYLTIIR